MWGFSGDVIYFKKRWATTKNKLVLANDALYLTVLKSHYCKVNKSFLLISGSVSLRCVLSWKTQQMNNNFVCATLNWVRYRNNDSELSRGCSKTRDNNIYTWVMRSTISRVTSHTCLCHSGVKCSLARNATTWKQKIMFLRYVNKAANF